MAVTYRYEPPAGKGKHVFPIEPPYVSPREVAEVFEHIAQDAYSFAGIFDRLMSGEDEVVVRIIGGGNARIEIEDA